MKFLKKICLAAFVLIATNSAFAAVNLGDTPLAGNVSLASLAADNTFTHTGTFTLTPPGQYNSSIIGFDFTSVATMLSPLSAMIYGATSGDLIGTIIGGTSELLNFTDVNNNYTFSITGQVSDPGAIPAGENLGFYSISASAVSPVPEASTIALMLSGLGIVGFMSRRRKS